MLRTNKLECSFQANMFPHDDTQVKHRSVLSVEIILAYMSGGLYYKTFYGRNLKIFVIS